MGQHNQEQHADQDVWVKAQAVTGRPTESLVALQIDSYAARVEVDAYGHVVTSVPFVRASEQGWIDETDNSEIDGGFKVAQHGVCEECGLARAANGAKTCWCE